jgi:hypothetical protein
MRHGAIESPAQRIVDLTSELKRAIETAPLEEQVLAGIVARDDFHATFALFIEAQRAHQARSGSRLAEVATVSSEIASASSTAGA